MFLMHTQKYAKYIHKRVKIALFSEYSNCFVNRWILDSLNFQKTIETILGSYFYYFDEFPILTLIWAVTFAKGSSQSRAEEWRMPFSHVRTASGPALIETEAELTRSWNGPADVGLTSVYFCWAAHFDTRVRCWKSPHLEASAIEGRRGQAAERKRESEREREDREGERQKERESEREGERKRERERERETLHVYIDIRILINTYMRLYIYI